MHQLISDQILYLINIFVFYLLQSIQDTSLAIPGYLSMEMFCIWRLNVNTVFGPGLICPWQGQIKITPDRTRRGNAGLVILCLARFIQRILYCAFPGIPKLTKHRKFVFFFIFNVFKTMQLLLNEV